MFLFHIQNSGFHYNISYIPVTVLCYILPPWPSYPFSLPFPLVSSPLPNSSLLVRMSHTNKHVRTHTSVAYGSLSNILLLIYNTTTSLPLFLFAPAKEVRGQLVGVSLSFYPVDPADGTQLGSVAAMQSPSSQPWGADCVGQSLYSYIAVISQISSFSVTRCLARNN